MLVKYFYIILHLLYIRSVNDYWILKPDTADVYLYATECFKQKSIISDSETILGFSPDYIKSNLLAINILQNLPFDLAYT